jgi:hypothetical protein
MNRRMFGTIAAAACLVMTAAFSGLFGGSSALAASTQQTFLTFYGWYDNTPPGADISYPQIHDTAGGRGTFADPITFATSTAELKAGTKVWVPRVKKYFIMEDSCQECGEDWSGHGPNGGPGLRHIDLWLGGKGGNAFDAINCEDALTHYNADNTPTLEPVIVDPPSNEPFDSTPLFNTNTGECYGGAQPNITVGQYKNGSNGQCLDDPGDSSSTGTQLKTAACNSGATSQRFTFEGAFLMIHNLCAAMSGSKVVLAKCNGGPSQQWSVNPNGTISDIQTGQKCVRVSGTNIVPGSCSGSASQWTFTPAGGGSADFGLSLNPASGTVTAGSATTATVSTSVVGGTAQSVALSATGAPAGVSVTLNPTSVTAGGSATLTVSTTAAAAAGTATITVTGTSSSVTHSASFQLTVQGSGGGTPVLLSQGRPATASSLESSSFPASAAFDGNLTSTRWASKEGADPQWLQVDLGAPVTVSHVTLTWEAAYAKAYTIQTSADGQTWTTIYTTTTGNGATDDLTALSGTGRYVRMNGTARGTSYGYSLYEMQVYGNPL